MLGSAHFLVSLSPGGGNHMNIQDPAHSTHRGSQSEYGRPAGLWIRLGAQILDGIIWIPLGCLTVASIVYFQSLELFVLCTVPGLLYKPFMESYYGATLGKMALNLEVIDEFGDRLDLRRAYIRFAPFLAATLVGELSSIWILTNADLNQLSGLWEWSTFVAENPTPLTTTHNVLNTCASLGCFVAAFTHRKRAFHDYLANSYCVYKFENVLFHTPTQEASPDISLSTGSAGPEPTWSAVTIMSIFVAFGLCGLISLKIFKPAAIQSIRSVEIENITAEEPPNATRILFLGNSHMYKHQIPRMVSRLVPEGEKPIWFRAIASPGVTTGWLWKQDEVLGLIENEEWDFIVLQPQSLEPVHDPKEFRHYVRKFESRAVHRGAKLLLWTPWARDPETDIYDVYEETWTGGDEKNLTERLSLAVREVADRSEACPIGDIWFAVRQEIPKAVLHSPNDGNHATQVGAYLTALSLYGCLDRNPSSVTWAPDNFSPDSAEKLRKITARELGKGVAGGDERQEKETKDGPSSNESEEPPTSPGQKEAPESPKP
jgi:uncharacterized RDD family membrane protein YckC